MKLIVTTAAHGIQTGEYKGDPLKQLLDKNRFGVTSLVSRGQAKWDHEDKKPADREAAPAEQPAGTGEEHY